MNFYLILGVDFKTRTIDLEGVDNVPKKVTLSVWDTAGQDRFRNIAKGIPNSFRNNDDCM